MKPPQHIIISVKKLPEPDSVIVLAYIYALLSKCGENDSGDSPLYRQEKKKFEDLLVRFNAREKEFKSLVETHKRTKTHLNGMRKRREADIDSVYRLGRLHALRDMREKLQRDLVKK